MTDIMDTAVPFAQSTASNLPSTSLVRPASQLHNKQDSPNTAATSLKSSPSTAIQSVSREVVNALGQDSVVKHHHHHHNQQRAVHRNAFPLSNDEQVIYGSGPSKALKAESNSQGYAQPSGPVGYIGNNNTYNQQQQQQQQQYQQQANNGSHLGMKSAQQFNSSRRIPNQEFLSPAETNKQHPAATVPLQGSLGILMGSSLLPKGLKGSNNNNNNHSMNHGQMNGGVMGYAPRMQSKMNQQQQQQHQMFLQQPQQQPQQQQQQQYAYERNPGMMQGQIKNGQHKYPSNYYRQYPNQQLNMQPKFELNKLIEEEILSFQEDVSMISYSSWISTSSSSTVNPASSSNESLPGSAATTTTATTGTTAPTVKSADFFSPDLLDQIEEATLKLENGDLTRFQVDISEQDNNGPFEFLKQFQPASESGIERTLQQNYFDVMENLDEYTEKLYQAIQVKAKEQLKKNHFNPLTLLQNNVIVNGQQQPPMFSKAMQRQNAKQLIKGAVQSVLEYSENRTVVPRYAREGDWLCQCGNLNFSYRPTCNKCDTIKNRFKHIVNSNQSEGQAEGCEESAVDTPLVQTNQQIIVSEFIWVCKCCRSINYCKSSVCTTCNMQKLIDRNTLTEITVGSQRKLEKYQYKLKTRWEKESQLHTALGGSSTALTTSTSLVESQQSTTATTKVDGSNMTTPIEEETNSENINTSNHANISHTNSSSNSNISNKSSQSDSCQMKNEVEKQQQQQQQQQQSKKISPCQRSDQDESEENSHTESTAALRGDEVDESGVQQQIQQDHELVGNEGESSIMKSLQQHQQQSQLVVVESQ